MARQQVDPSSTGLRRRTQSQNKPRQRSIFCLAAYMNRKSDVMKSDSVGQLILTGVPGNELDSRNGGTIS